MFLDEIRVCKLFPFTCKALGGNALIRGLVDLSSPGFVCRKENCFQAFENEGRFEPNDYVGIPHMIWDSYATTDKSVYSCLIQLTIASCILKRWIELAFSNHRFISTSTRYLFPSLDIHVGNSTQTRKGVSSRLRINTYLDINKLKEQNQ